MEKVISFLNRLQPLSGAFCSVVGVLTDQFKKA
jgi:hypothetical protein